MVSSIQHKHVVLHLHYQYQSRWSDDDLHDDKTNVTADRPGRQLRPVGT